jgi:aminoglycoside phosphotransferase (APT) family kinase protein
MRSRDTAAKRIDIDAPLVRQLIAAQFPQWADLPIRPVPFDGWDNRTFRLGEHMTVRLPSAAAYVAQVEKEHRWLPKLAPLVPLAIPVPLALGVPAAGYPWPWSVYPWIEGDNATIERIADIREFATALARFLVALQRIDSTGGPRPGRHNFFRGGGLATYDAETRDAIAALDGWIDDVAATAVWQAALESTWQGPPVWVHGDVSAANLLVTNGRLNAVIDFGCSGVGDPACDLTIAWTFFGADGRDAFRANLPADDATWARARGWALWKALITIARCMETDPAEAEKARRVVAAVLSEHSAQS